MGYTPTPNSTRFRRTCKLSEITQGATTNIEPLAESTSTCTPTDPIPSSSEVTIKYEIQPDTIDSSPSVPSVPIEAVQQTANSSKLSRAYLLLKEKMKRLAPFLHPIHKQLLTTDKKVKFYTNRPTSSVFEKLCVYMKDINIDDTS